MGRDPYVRRRAIVRSEGDARRDLRTQFTEMHDRWLKWSTPDADSIRSSEEGHVRRSIRQKYLGDTEIGGPRLRSSRSRKLQLARKSLQKEV